MPSEVEIANLALLMLGDSPITSFDEVFVNSDRARLCATFYPQVRDEVLRAHPWNCARVRAQLSALASPPVYGYAYQYQLPVSPYCLKVLSINDSPHTEFVVEGRKLLTNEGSVKLLYIGRVDPGEFDPLLVSAMARRLAAHLAYPITGKTTLFEAMWKAYELILAEARSIDSQEGTPVSFMSDDLVRVR